MDTKKLSPCWLFIFFTCLQFGVQAEGGFIFTLPNVLRYGGTSEFCLTLHGDNQSPNVTMALVKAGKRVLQVRDTFPIGKQKCKKFQVPKPGDYSLVLSNDTGRMHDDVALSVLGDKLLTLVQTDKPIYKPGQKVKFRVLTLMSDLKPKIGKIKSIFVIDPNDIRVKQYLNVETKGISSLEFQLAAEAKRGNWKIEVLVDEADEQYKQKTFGDFEVKEYVLPRFEVEIIPPLYILANQKSVEAKVCAKYTYGKNVTGFLSVSACWTSYYGPPVPCVNNVVQISGCHVFSIQVADVNERSYHFDSYELQIKASVTEEGTGVVVNASKNGPTRTQTPLNIQLDDYTNGFFKPGLPFYGKATVANLDGTPAEGESITITASDTSNNLKFSKTFITDRYGIVEFSLCRSFTEDSKHISIHAAAEKYSSIEGLNTPSAYKGILQWFSPSLSYIQIPRIDLSGQCGKSLTLSIPFTTQMNTDVEFNYQVMTKGKVITTGQISYNQSTSYPGRDQILPPSNICLENKDATPEPTTTSQHPSTVSDETSTQTQQQDVESVEPDDSLHSRQARSLFIGSEAGIEEPNIDQNPEFNEPIVRSQNVSDVVANFLLDVPINPAMSPKFTLLVYYIRPDGEVVADSMQFEINPCFENEVEMEFNKTTVLPGENVDINLTASPGSVCAIGVVDKSVNILGGKHQITPELVFKKMGEFNIDQFADSSIGYQRDDYCKKRLQKSGFIQEFYHSTISRFVDAMQAFKSSGFLVLSNLDIETRPCTVEKTVYYDGAFLNEYMVPGPIASISRSSVPPSPQTSVRTNFPETWLWDLHIVGETGATVLKETTPHTITEWVGNAMCLEQEKGFGISKLTSLTTFQPFFLSLNLPYAAVRGEKLPIMFTVYNYLEKCLHIQLTLDLEKNFKIHNFKQHRDPVCICGGNSYTAKFYATANEIGQLPVFAKAEIVPGLCENMLDVDTTYVGLSDAVKRQVFVKPEGVEQEYTHTSYICSKVSDSKQENIILPLPAEGEMVKDSARGEVKLIGDIMGPVLTNLNNLVKMPAGCGEQNMIGFVPNILVLKYLTSIGKVTKYIQDNAVKYMEIGYQRELNYRHKDGSYSAFGENDKKGSVWLTAFVVKSFAQARPFIYIDEKDMTLSLKFLRFNQLETGCFRETGKVFQSYMMGGLGSDKDAESNTALTAYVLIALLSANVNTSEPVIVSGMSCINNDFQQKKGKMDPYTLSLVAYANSLHQPNNRIGHEILRVLESKANRNGSLKYWSRETPKPKPVNTWYYHAAPSAEVEMTSYALMAYLNLFGKRGIEHSHNIAMWLSQQRNPNGGFSSTQDTVVGLQALSEFASLAYNKEGTELEISVTGKQMNDSFSVSEKEHTTLLLQSVPIHILPNSLSITTKGVGCVLVQSSVHYNKQPKDLQSDERRSFHLKVRPTKYVDNIDKCDRRTISLSVGKRGNHQGLEDGMSLVTIRMVTSWSPVPDSLIKLKSLFPILGIKRMEYSEEQGLLTLYFDEISKKPKEFSIDVEQDRDLAVSSPKPAEVKIVQYYETDVSAIESYELKTTCGTKAEIPINPPEDDDQSPFLQRRVDLSLIPGEQRRRIDGTDVCPICVPIKHEPKNLKELVCNATAVYKTIAGRKGAKPLKLIQNLRSEKKDKLNIFASYKMATGCDCSVLSPPGKRVLMFLNEAVSADHILNLDGTSMVLIADKKIEKQVRKLRKSCS